MSKFTKKGDIIKKYTTKKGKFGIEVYVADPLQDGYTAYFGEFPGIIAEGKTINEAQKNLWNAVYNMLIY